MDIDPKNSPPELGKSSQDVAPPSDAAIKADDESKVLLSLKDVHVSFPVHNGSSRSLQLDIIRMLGFKTAKHQESVKVNALRGLTFDLHEGERVGFIGHNGAGKTTLLRTMSGAYEPTQGTLTSQGRVTAMTDFTMGMDPEASGRENIIFRGVFMGMSFEEIEGHIDDVIEFTELHEFIDLPIRTYSSGMFIRLAFAVSTIITPDVLLLDEIIAAGDLGFQEKLRQRLNEYIGDARLIVLAAHDLGSVREYCTRVLWMRNGQVVMDGATEEVVDAYLEAGA